jgi:hypothetical protein
MKCESITRANLARYRKEVNSVAKEMDDGSMMGKADMKELMLHLQNHIMYPASKRTIVESCNQMAHVPASTRTWAEQNLPDGTYMSADEVVMKLGI